MNGRPVLHGRDLRNVVYLSLMKGRGIKQMDKRVKGKEMRICTVAPHYTAGKDKFHVE